MRKSLAIYFIKPVGMEGPVKIGRSCSPDNRLSTLETWCPFPLEIVAQIEGPPELERRFHQHFLDLYIRHEWFRVSNELQAVMREINEGVFNVDSLPEPKKLPTAQRNNSYATPAWRYKTSVCSRLRKISYHSAAYPEIKRFFGVSDPHRFAPEMFIENKAAIEGFIESLNYMPARP